MGKILTRPLLGFNSYDCWGPDMNEERALANIEAFAQKLQPFGYEYFCFDAGWFLDLYYMERLNNPEAEKIKNLDEFGRLNPSKVKFPRGFKPITDACHSRGFKFGLHFMRGIPKLAVERRCRIKGTNYFAADIADVDNDCAWGSENYGVDMSKPGAQEYYDSILEFTTLNNPPIPIYRKLSYLDYNFTAKYADEVSGYGCGIIVSYNRSIHNTKLQDCSKKAYKISKN